MTDHITFRSDMRVELVDHVGDDAKIARAARQSTGDKPGGNRLVKALLAATPTHWSPFEHCSITIMFDVPMFVRDQIVRHKSMSFSVFSLRYSEARPEFWVPAVERPLLPVGRSLDYRREMASPEVTFRTRERLEANSISAFNTYDSLLGDGIAPEVARAALPPNAYTSLWVTGSLRSWFHFLESRMDQHAQWEIQDAAVQVAEIVADLFPVAYEGWVEAAEENRMPFLESV